MVLSYECLKKNFFLGQRQKHYKLKKKIKMYYRSQIKSDFDVENCYRNQIVRGMQWSFLQELIIRVRASNFPNTCILTVLGNNH
jgi:hypothetical protein